MAEEEPAAGEYLLQLLLVDGLLAENAGADQALVQVDQIVDFCQDHDCLLDWPSVWNVIYLILLIVLILQSIITVIK